jgi:hypothetical protein
MRRLKYLALMLTFFPVMPDLCCVHVYAGDETAVESADVYLSAILFFLCALLGNRLWKVFINSFEKGSF